MLSKEMGDDRCEGASEEIIYRIEIPANRYDLLCQEGLSRALLIFQNKIPIPSYRKSVPELTVRLLATKQTQHIRPFVVAAILRDVTFTPAVYDSFIDLQDKLHQNICRKRSLASIGTHDLDTVQGPFTYTALPPNDIRFIPLNQSREFTAPDLLEFYSEESHLKSYVPIIKDLPLYPVVLDKNGVVLSLPPIINGNHSKISLNTRNVFIEVTATNLQKAIVVLDTMVTMFSQYCAHPFTIEPVQVQNEHQQTNVEYPQLKYRQESVDINEINQTLGIQENGKSISLLLQKMGIQCTQQATGGDQQIQALIPPTRHDILHQCDIAEDVGIAFGYNHIEQKFPSVVTVGKQLHINKLTDQLRYELSRCGYTEVLTFSLCSREDVGRKLRQDFAAQKAVEISNPKTIDFQVARTSLIPGLLKTANSNKKMPLPLRLFEISDVVLQDTATETNACNQRRLCALYYNKSPGFELLHGLLDRIMQVLEIPYAADKGSRGYFIRKLDDSTFLERRCAEVVVDGVVRGRVGVLHPEVILNFELTQPCSALELNIQAIA